MSFSELNIHFPISNQVIIEFDGDRSELLSFKSPVLKKDLEDLRWYIEVYGAQYTGEPDDEEAKRIEAKLITLGEALFEAVFSTDSARDLFQKFQQQHTDKLLTIHTNEAQILALPWELLREPENGFLSQQQPPISIRRFYVQNQSPIFPIQAKSKLRLLFIVSRPQDVSFLNPRLDPQAVMDALAENNIRCEVEFLRPATLTNLTERLNNKDLPPIDIIHFDGHGVYREKEQLGYLLFESSGDPDKLSTIDDPTAGKKHEVSAALLGKKLKPHNIALVVLSACQSATVGNEPLGSVAAGLTDKGVPTVLAMVYSVLVTTTRQLFASFYQALATEQSVGAALDNARQAMAQHNQRGKRRRGEGEFELTLQDWFVPALYQASNDSVLLSPPDLLGFKNLEGLKRSDLPALQAAGFFGRSFELWQIERWFVQGVERVTITGFGGQGKTYCAIEAAQWLLRTDLFDAVCFVDFSRYQGLDALRYAMNALGVLLDTTLLDENAVPPLLQTRRLLWVWDNLESLAAETLEELLKAAAEWSKSTPCRFLFTTRQHRFTQVGYEDDKSNPKHQYLDLGGLAEADALDYFNQLWQTAPQPELTFPVRYELMALFGKVAFHPLSIGLLAQQLKTRTIAELGERLEALLLCKPEEYLSARASVKLSLARLNLEERALIKLLGVFQNGAMENILLEVTELGEIKTEDDIYVKTGEILLNLLKATEDTNNELEVNVHKTIRKLITCSSHFLKKKTDNYIWENLKKSLEEAALITNEDLTYLGIKIPYIKFTPNLSAILWEELTFVEQSQLLNRYCQSYYNLSCFFYSEDSKNPSTVRAIIKRELFNFIHAVEFSLRNKSDFVVEFSNNVSEFFDSFGFQKENDKLISASQKLHYGVGTQKWLLARLNQGKFFYANGEYTQAENLFQKIVYHLDKSPNYFLCLNLNLLGRCFIEQGKLSAGINCYRQSLNIAQQLKSSIQLQKRLSVLYCDLANAFRDSSNYPQAELYYEQSLTIAKKINDEHQQAVLTVQFGILSMLQENLKGAYDYYQQALYLFQKYEEPIFEADVWHQLGLIYQKSDDWELSEQAYRKAAYIKESQGINATNTWINLAKTSQKQGKLPVAEKWLQMAKNRAIKYINNKDLFIVLSNLADLLQNQVSRLDEARKFAEQALGIQKTLDESTTKIWLTYEILEKICDKQGDIKQAEQYRQLSCESYLRFEGMIYEISEWKWLIMLVLKYLINQKGYILQKKYSFFTVQSDTSYFKNLLDSQKYIEMEKCVQQMKSWKNLINSIENILNGERNEDILFKFLSYKEAAIIYLILEGISDPESLETLFNA